MSRELFTMGYEGTTIDTFIGNLQAKRIDCVLDIRALPLSRKPGFSKKKLAERLCLVGIRYIHLAELGTPKNFYLIDPLLSPAPCSSYPLR